MDIRGQCVVNETGTETISGFSGLELSSMGGRQGQLYFTGLYA